MIRKVLSLFVILTFVLCTQAQKKQDISVLYVGYSPAKEMSAKSSMGWTSSERFKEEYKTRMPAFMDYLNLYFAKVESVDAREYTADLSDNFDITIFDEVVKPLKEMVYEKDPKTGKTLKFEPAVYLPEGFNRPSVFMGHPAARLGKSLGSKLDWYCLCLNRYAHHTKFNHAIFKGPFKVDLTIKNRPTPSPIFHYYDGLDMPAEIPMWEVNTEGYHDGKGYRIGMVARGWGFEDSPDAEMISSGECDKQKTAVAIGRHGNFFLWGFAGSPDYMTEEAKRVFANSIVYTHKHAEDRIIAKKYNDRIATKVFLDELFFYTTSDAYKASVETFKDINEQGLKTKAIAEKKMAAGEELSEMETLNLNFEPIPTKTREEFLQKRIGRISWAKKIGLDTLVVRKYLTENRDYFYSEPNGFFDLKVDEDCKSLGIANSDIKILDKVIGMLENDVDVEKANRILMRYTLEDFATAKEWRTWFKKYKSKMFFTEAGGYVWMINDANANPNVRPRADKKVEAKKEVAKVITDLKLDVPTHAEPVSVGAIVIDGDKQGEKSILIKTNIMDGYHIYAYVPKGEAYIKTEQGIELPAGAELVGKWKKSSPAPYPGKDGILIYHGESKFEQAIKLDEDLPAGSVVKCWLYYQCCDASICFPPKKKEFVLEL
ncbi:MAG: hypothetical protein JEZ01_05450 [Labilibaculum sp.]|nr:protein-disulfide reductase DsbD domain-containing protein [Labilibaculum sp.]MBI9057197.1 hypothetical protein [Labilibaculum sp.]